MHLSSSFPPASFKAILALRKARKFKKAFEKLENLLLHHTGCAHLWNMRGDLIQLFDSEKGPPLAQAAASYKRALKLNPGDLEALEGLAHFYDVVIPRPATAKRYARTYVAKAEETLAEMKAIITGADQT